MGLVKSEVDFMRMGPASYILAKQQNAQVQLLAMEIRKGKKRFKGVIIISANSKITELSQNKVSPGQALLLPLNFLVSLESEVLWISCIFIDLFAPRGEELNPKRLISLAEQYNFFYFASLSPLFK